MKRNLYEDSEDFEYCINWNPHSNDQDEDLPISLKMNSPSNALEAQKRRTSHKNKYINKITLIKPEETANTKKKVIEQVGLQPDQLKKLKNREAAKESRERKKLYINLIEEQTKQLEKELESTNREIENCKVEIQKSTFNSNQSIGAFDSKLVHVFKKMERLIAEVDGEERNNELNLAIDSMLYRFGATGKERKSNITETYRKILSLSLPILHRYMLWAANERSHLFLSSHPPNPLHEPWFEEMRQSGVNQESNNGFLEWKRQQILSNFEKMEGLLGHLKGAKNEMEGFCNILDNLFLEIREILTPSQSAKLVLIVEKYKYREELRYLEEMGFRQGERVVGEEGEGAPRKHRKLEWQP